MLFDPLGVPRYWATIWALYQTADWAASTQRKQLSHLEAFYQFSEEHQGYGALDDAISCLNFNELSELLETYFIFLRNRPDLNHTSQLKWRTAYRFLTDTILRMGKADLHVDRLRSMFVRLERLEVLYGQLRLGRKSSQDIVRALPANTVEALYETLDPTSPQNPFRGIRSRWRVFVSFVLLLHQGLRRGELLILTPDAVRHGFDSSLNRIRYWLSVVDNPYERHDLRYSTPSIKTVNLSTPRLLRQR